MSYYPINIDVSGKRALVVGGGAVAERKVRVLLEFGAKVIVVAPEITPDLQQLKDAGKIVWEPRFWRPEDLDGICLVFAATNDRNVNQEIFKEASSRGVLLNCVDQPDLCNFIVPAIVRRGYLVISVSTSGHSPALAAWIRGKIEEEFGDEYGKLTELTGLIRKRLIEAGFSPEDFKENFEEFFSTSILEKIRKADKEGIKKIVVSIFGEDLL